MPTVTVEPVITASPTDQYRKRWTRTEFNALENSGLLAGQHLELIGGELLNKMGKAGSKPSKPCGAAFIPASKTSSRPSSKTKTSKSSAELCEESATTA